ncbi:small-conductance mechanosensitive channel [Sphingobium sp. OAS761]|uniref:mechanosensitive ion channel family protein n=1 Tax=Sphingobium sp. OAS761 TaxID=2817901 RepID=UPI00209D3883|nr:mechanosensitive ion channel domain-containing protein [Sphingobium sp. OAS761]MCP1470701.1 small-conductance mechanosensitive channel [Sphingobium sp. OAS761]
MSDISLTHISPMAALSLAVTVAAAFLVHWALYAIAIRVLRARMTPVLLPQIFHPTRWLVVLTALGAGLQPLDMGPKLAALWSIGSQMLFALLTGWLVFGILRAIRQMIERHSNLDVEDNLKARRRHTRVRILYRISQSVVAVLVAAMILIAIPGVRSIGVTLAASAGLVGLAVGAAAQPALKNLIAGIQMAFSEPIRLDDVVIVEGEWGRIEDITLTYVVVRIWDDRRMVVPVSYFLEKPFQNWTTRTSDLLGTVFFYVDPAADVGRIRDAFVNATKANSRWDGRVAILQVTDHRADALELRGLLSARNAGIAFDLRCEVREAVMDFLRLEMPDALVRNRQRLEAAGGFATMPSGGAG